MAAADLQSLLDMLRREGPVPARRFRETLGISQATLSRLTRAAGDSVIRIGRARATRYAARRDLGSLGREWPAYRVDEQGRPHLAATLHALHPRGWWYEAVPPSPWLHGDFATGLFPDLPWFVGDVRPQGFLGRAFARRHGRALGLGDDPQLWSADAVLSVLLQFGDDLPGDFVLGEACAERVLAAALRAPDSVEVERRADRYGELAEAALAGDVAGSSAGGEQPKFAACVHDGATYEHRLVKFSPPLDTPAGRRWADLLVCEHLAAETLREHGESAATTSVLDGRTRRFLEIARFDRVGPHGRRGYVSLLSLANACGAPLDSWPAAALRLEREGWLGSGDAATVRLWWRFGTLIGNADMHLANVSLALGAARPLPLAPAYDMLPMHYRPTAGGEVVTHDFTPALPPLAQRSLWLRAAEMALAFWRRAAGDGRISADFRDEASRVLARTSDLRARLDA